MNRLGPKKLSRTVADLVYSRTASGYKQFTTFKLWGGMQPRANKFQQSSLPNY